MEQLLASIKDARNDLLRRSDNARSLSSASIRKLPPEVLEEIFASYISEEGGGYALSLRRHGRRDHISCPTLKLSWVCSFWRSLVLDCPKLWSSLKLSSQVLFCQPGSFPIFLKYIYNSGENLLDIHFDGGRFDSSPNARVDKAIDILLDNSMRWRTAVLLITNASANDWFSASSRLNARSGSGSPARNPPPGDFSALEHLEMPQSLSWSDELSGIFRTFSRCPRLETYHGSSFSLAVSGVDFSHVKELALTSSVIGKSFGHLLYRLPELESLTVANFQLSEDGTDDPLLREATHYTSALSKLKLTSRTLQPEAWRFIRLPSLTELHISIVSADHFANLIYLSSVLLESGCQLQTLRLYVYCFMEQQQQQALLDFITLHPSLVNLVISLQSDEEVQCFVQNLQPKGDPPSRLASNLRSLKLQWTVHLYQDFDQTLCSSICEMVKSRCTVRKSHATGKLELAGLQSLTLVLSDGDSHNTFSQFVHTQLSTLEDAGLILDVQSDYE
ncbi:hypothetical protein GYMLUDRAFT_578276 [Collybiopsis luxurians FD-317 M1]|uniref:F-box domain-containing protein n=1 Tax=Collybiopsis luxurians FD-317 M1 TaxID=944289 RepID=A0A0D0BDJ9_9AGAR|nr:hypothetical protein GYMLUDRAFT_578276 [Collybiopsis luxurians FD-317 M1]